MTASSPGSLLICRSLVIRQLVLPPLPSGRVRTGASCETLTLMAARTHWGMFPLFPKRTANATASRLSIVFLRILRLGSFPGLLEQANVTPIPKGTPSSSVTNYRPISITPVLSKVVERLLLVRLGRFTESSGVLPTTQFAYRKGLGKCVALLCVSHTLQNSLESEQKAKIMQIDFSTDFDMVNHQGFLYKLCSVGIGGSVLSILTQFLSNQ